MHGLLCSGAILTEIESAAGVEKAAQQAEQPVVKLMLVLLLHSFRIRLCFSVVHCLDTGL